MNETFVDPVLGEFTVYHPTAEEAAEFQRKCAECDAFTNAAIEACKGYDTEYAFKCPLCGGTAHVFRTSFNGHHSAKCDSCGMDFVQ